MTSAGGDPVLRGTTLHPGAADGELQVLDAPLSFWGGSELATGVVVDGRHPQRGTSLAGRVLLMTSGRGSSSSSSVLAEQIRTGVSPAAIVLAEPDAIIVIGAIVAAELYDLRVPVVRLAAREFEAVRSLPNGTPLRVRADDDGAVVHAR